jgi:putative membrane protein
MSALRCIAILKNQVQSNRREEVAMKRALLILLVIYFSLSAYAVTSVLVGAIPPFFVTPLNTLIAFTFALLHAVQRQGWKNALLMLVTIVVVSLTFEAVGVATGWVYGPYHYSDQLGPRFLGLVPYIIPLAWFMMMYSSYVIADWLIPATSKRWQRVLTVSAVSGVVMTAWDMVMDPMMVAGGNWIWEISGDYFGIPLQNFAGWWFTTFAATLVYLFLSPHADSRQASKLDLLPIISYLITSGSAVAVMLKYQPAIGLIGFMVLAPWVIASLAKMSDTIVDSPAKRS